GTHTLGILAGGYRGDVQAGIMSDSQAAPVSTVANPYYGVATEAHLAAVCGDLYDRLIAEGIERILDYSYYKQEPCVISLSLGSNTGVHSAKSPMSQYLDQAAREAIIVVSSGNEGDVPLSLVKDLSENDLEAKSFILPTAVEGIRAGQVYMYSEAPFEMQAVIYNKSRDRVSFRMPIVDGQVQGGALYYCSSDFAESEYDIIAQPFANAFRGYVGVGWDYDELSEMYLTIMDYYTQDIDENGNYLLGFIVTGQHGQHIECFCDGFYTVLDSYGVEGWDTGSTDMSISDMACANDILVVGSYNTGDTYGALDGNTYNFNGQFTVGKISPFSSYGRLNDGRSLPHVCGPGAVIVSSCSQYYVDNKDNKVDINALCARADEDGRVNYWCPAMGTSMSAPYVAGCIALWLEADPTLTIADVKEIINATAVRDAEVEAGNPVQWGAGKFDAYSGRKEVILRSSLNGIEADSTVALMVSTSDNRHFEIFLGGASTLNAAVYNTSGAIVAHEKCNGDELALDLSHLTSGIYIINVNDTMSRRVIVN
ncbi:MAG: S8 family peptidase, partial [Muribaculaceae bacterium]|nr:S8 family peptidase [Muribaculaceae bacterium]